MSDKPIDEAVRAQATAWFTEYDKHNHFPEMLALDAYAAGHAAAQQQFAEIEALRSEVGAVREALEMMVEMVEMNGFGRDCAMDVARAVLRREAKP
jgi:bacterioferritin-associated ferredoxin